MNILVVEDDADLSGLLVEALELSGSVVTVAATVAAALEAWQPDVYDLVLLDLTLPDGTGFEVLSRIRSESERTPVLILSGLGNEADIIQGLDQGADGYLIKPVSIQELEARIRALHRRARAWSDGRLEFDDLSLDQTKHSVTGPGGGAHLTEREFGILRLLMLADGDIVSREQLLHHVWRIEFDPATTLIDTTVHRLRSKLRSAGSAVLLQAVRGEGFHLSR